MPSMDHCTTLSGYIFSTKARIDNRKKPVKQQYLPHMSLQYGALRPTSGWDRFVSLGHLSKLQRVSRLGFIAATSLTGSQPNFARCLAVSWAATLYIHFRGLLPPDGISPRAKFTFRPSLAFSYIGSVTARHSSSGHPNFVAWCKEWNYRTFPEVHGPPIFGWAAITLGIGPHSTSWLYFTQVGWVTCVE